MEENKVQLQEIYDRLVRLIEALARLDSNDDWKTVKKLVFDKSLSSIERQIKNSALNKEVNLNQIYRLQGEWAWAKQFSDVKSFIENLKTQLEDVKSKLQK